MKVSKKDLKLLIGLVGVLCLVCVYFLVYKPLGEKTTKLTSENATLKSRVSELQALTEQKEFFESEIVRMEAENNEIRNRFPADVRSEDVIMLATDLANASPAEMNSVSMEEPEDVYHLGGLAAQQTVNAQATNTQTADAQTAADAATQPTTVAPVEQPAAAEQVLYGRKIQLNYKCNYDELKRGIQYLFDSTDRRIVGAVNATYDVSTGMLDVSLGTGLYYLTGTQREYTEPNIPYIPQGTDNIFGTLDLPSTTYSQSEEE